MTFVMWYIELKFEDRSKDSFENSLGSTTKKNYGIYGKCDNIKIFACYYLPYGES